MYLGLLIHELGFGVILHIESAIVIAKDKEVYQRRCCDLLLADNTPSETRTAQNRTSISVGRREKKSISQA